MESKNLKVSLIIAVYKDIEALKLILESLKHQTYSNFEVIVAEDNNSIEMKEFVDSIDYLDIQHTYQDDIGIRKMRSLNNAILKSSGKYLIFIDGDCIPYSTFIEGHILSAQDGYICSGRRVNLGPKFSKNLRDNKISSLSIEKYFFYYFPFLVSDSKERHLEEGFYFNPNGFFYKYFIKKRKSNTQLLGCNYSCFKKDIVAINGYDEGYGETAVGDDTDIEWRFVAYGLKIKSVRNIANQFHLYHSRSFRDNSNDEKELDKMYKNKSKNLYFCKYGLNTH